ncbi:Type 4 fimbrial assembly protein PilC [Nymphon striatum]|nr:Type 4 fimbrial assembly protein PilC [Nymphon striatum]
MMRAGVPMVQSLELISNGHEKPAMRELIKKITKDIEGAGEQAGTLEDMIDKVATYKEKTERMKAKVKKAMMYPVIVIIAAVVVSVIMLVWVIPTFKDIFAGFGADLPAFTLWVIGLSEWLQANCMVVQMAKIGEESGRLEEMLDKVADYFEEQVDDLVDTLSKQMEPMIMAVLGVLVGGLVVAMYLPIFKLGAAVGKCSSCKTGISIQYPLVELATAAISVFVAWKVGFGWQALAALIFTWTLITLSLIDAKTMLLPDNLTIPLMWLGKEGMGYGDFKILAAIGAWAGWQVLPFTIFAASLVGAVVGLCVIFSVYIYSDSKLLKVSITPLSSILISTKNSAPANIISLNNATISAEITGRALSIHAEAGSFVRKGEKLATLDCRSYVLAKTQADAALKVAKTQLNLAKKQFTRNQRLIKNGTIPREIFERTEAAQQTSLADIELKKAAIENARLTIKRCSIKAPFSGQITQRSNAIEFVSGEKRVKTSIRSIIQNIDVTTRTQEVRLSLSDTTQLAAGLSGRLEWSDENLQLPTEFIQRKGQNLGVMIAEEFEDGTAKAKFIALKNAIEGQPASIDLPQETAVINKNQYRVSDGQLISIQ